MEGLRRTGGEGVKGGLGDLRMNQRASTLVSGGYRGDEEEHLDDGTPLGPTTRRSRRTGRNRRRISATLRAATNVAESTAHTVTGSVARSQDDSTDLHDAAGTDARRVVKRGGTTAWSKRSNLTISRRPVVREDATDAGETPREGTTTGTRTTGARPQGETRSGSTDPKPTRPERPAPFGARPQAEDRAETGPSTPGPRAVRTDRPGTEPRATRTMHTHPAPFGARPQTEARAEGVPGSAGPKPARTERPEVSAERRDRPAVFGLRSKPEEGTGPGAVETPAHKATEKPAPTPRPSRTERAAQRRSTPRSSAFGARTVRAEGREQPTQGAPRPSGRAGLISQRKQTLTDRHRPGKAARGGLLRQVINKTTNPAAAVVGRTSPFQGGRRAGLIQGAVQAPGAAARVVVRAAQGVRLAVAAAASAKGIAAVLIVAVVVGVVMSILAAVPSIGQAIEDDARSQCQATETRPVSPPLLPPETADKPAGCATRPPGEITASGWTLPTNGPVTSGFGYRTDPVTGALGDFHDATDFGAQCKAPIYAAADGTVARVGSDYYGGYGVVVDHGGGLSTVYWHPWPDGIFVKEGDSVKAGQQIAEVGSSGKSTACHLHFKVLVNGTPIDPVPFLVARGVL